MTSESKHFLKPEMHLLRNLAIQARSLAASMSEVTHDSQERRNGEFEGWHSSHPMRPNVDPAFATLTGVAKNRAFKVPAELFCGRRHRQTEEGIHFARRFAGFRARSRSRP